MVLPPDADLLAVEPRPTTGRRPTGGRGSAVGAACTGRRGLHGRQPSVHVQVHRRHTTPALSWLPATTQAAATLSASAFAHGWRGVRGPSGVPCPKARPGPATAGEVFEDVWCRAPTARPLPGERWRSSTPRDRREGRRPAYVVSSRRPPKLGGAKSREVNAPHLVSLVRAGARLERGQLDDRPPGRARTARPRRWPPAGTASQTRSREPRSRDLPAKISYLRE